ncbi:MAG: hypothetical protein ABJE66_22700 [Deltaproteobacteria bacterium]
MSLLILVACGGDGARHLPDGGAPPDDTSATVDAAPDHGGSISVETYPDGRALAFAEFLHAAPPPPTCTTNVRIGACALTRCTSGADTDSAGRIAIQAGMPAQATITMAPPSSGAYSYPPTVGNGAFTAGAPITFTATGDTVPAFSDTLAFPMLPAITSPVPGATIAHDADLVFTWSGGPTPAEVVIFLIDATGTYLSCGILPAPGDDHVTIPGALVGMLVPDATGKVTVGTSMYALKQLTAGDYTIVLYAGGEPLSSVTQQGFEGSFVVQ